MAGSGWSVRCCAGGGEAFPGVIGRSGLGHDPFMRRRAWPCAPRRPGGMWRPFVGRRRPAVGEVVVRPPTSSYCVRSRPARVPPAGSAARHGCSRPPEVAMLQVRNVRKVYDGRTVVNDVNFEVAAGEIFALLGPNGAGKTTLIRMITDIVRPDGGTIA